MPNYTETLKLLKPTEDEFYNVAVPNANMDALDTYIKELQEQNSLLRAELANKADLSGTEFTGVVSFSNSTAKANTWNNISNMSDGNAGAYDLNTLFQPGFYGIGTGSTNTPTDYGNMLILPYRLTESIYPIQLFCGHDNAIYHRLYNARTSTWGDWHKLTSVRI